MIISEIHVKQRTDEDGKIKYRLPKLSNDNLGIGMASLNAYQFLSYIQTGVVLQSNVWLFYLLSLFTLFVSFLDGRPVLA